MKYALVCGKKTEATKGAIGFCPGCGSEMIAKCGEVKIHHWAHKGTRHCDRWWEPETEWHRAWKGHFPEDWQEVIHTADDGENHIADVQISNGLVIELQHSHIDPEERTSRENFYKNMIWVVDGTRLKRDYPRFIKVRGNLHRTSLEGYFLVGFPEEYFPSAWLDSKVPVIFDFMEMESINDNSEFELRNKLYCLFPERKYNNGILAIFSRELFIEKAFIGELSILQPTITVRRRTKKR